MPINIEWQVKPPGKHEEKTQMFPRITDSPIVGEQQLAELIAAHGSLSRGNAKTALNDLVDVMATLLREGKTINLPQLGSFKLSIGTDAEIHPDSDRRMKSIVVRGVNFQPAQAFMDAIGKPSFQWRPTTGVAVAPTAAQLQVRSTTNLQTGTGTSRCRCRSSSAGKGLSMSSQKEKWQKQKHLINIIMTFNEVFKNKKPVIGMIHTGSNDEHSMLELAKKEIEIYLKYGVVPLIENYFGSANDCAEVLEWMHTAHPEMIYGVNILGDEERAFELACKYGAKFIQIDSVCGHLHPKYEPSYVQQLQADREKYGVAVLGGVRFKYQPVYSGRTTEEDLLLGKERCDAVVCTGSGTGMETPMNKVEQFKATLGDFPVVVGAGVTLDTAQETMSKSDGMIVGSWFKFGHDAHHMVNEAYVKAFMEAIEV